MPYFCGLVILQGVRMPEESVSALFRSVYSCLVLRRLHARIRECRKVPCLVPNSDQCRHDVRTGLPCFEALHQIIIGYLLRDLCTLDLYGSTVRFCLCLIVLKLRLDFVGKRTNVGKASDSPRLSGPALMNLTSSST